MNTAYASTSFVRPARRAFLPRLRGLIAGWQAQRSAARARRQLAELPPHLRRDLGLGPALHRAPSDTRSFDHNRPVGSAGAYW